ncbi:MAG TPA: patatin-like phospholipase family protein [Acidobacteriaceae bacterium]|nr:patatin-like phospholipase family protein [Acidobacteriaceae bacterium]
MPQVSPPPAPHRLRIGLALGGGGALGLAHIGVLQWFDEHHVPVDALAGTSMGALIGGLYATGRSPEDLKTVVSEDVFMNVFRLDVAYNSLDYRRRQDRRAFPNSFTLGLRNGVNTRNSLLTDEGLDAFLDDIFLRYDNRTNFDHLPIPFRCVATDLNTSKPVVLSSGSLPDAIRASVSLPGVFSPVEVHGHALVDGGVVENLPVQIVRAMHVDVVIAVSLPMGAITPSDTNSIVGVLQRSFSVAIEQNEEASRRLANIVIMPQTQHYTSSDYSKSAQLIQLGYEAAEKMRAQLLPYALNDADWQQYLKERAARQAPRPGPVRFIDAQGAAPNVRKAAHEALAAQLNNPPDPKKIERDLDAIRGNAEFEADYQTTFREGGYSGAQAENTGILVRIHQHRYGPPYLYVGGDIAAITDGVTRQIFSMRLIQQDFGGFGSELRSNVQLGFLTNLSSEYYRQLNHDGLFVAPHVEMERQPIYIYQNQDVISQRLQQNAGGGVDFGRTFNPLSELRLGWQSEVVRWHTQIGNDGMPDFSGVAQMAGLTYTYDNQDRAIVPEYGLKMQFAGNYLFQVPDGRDAPVFTLGGSFFHTLATVNTLSLAVSGGTSFNRDLSGPFQFTLGGPLRLTASQIDEYRGTDYSYVRALYMRRIGTLGPPLGQHIYATFGYEGGSVWNPDQDTIERQDGLAGVVAETPVGAVMLSGSVGNAGHRKIVFTLGHLF